MNVEIDSRTDEGVTLGLIDGLLATFRVLRSRDLTPQSVVDALHDMATDRDVHAIVGTGRLYLFEKRDALLSKSRRTAADNAELRRVTEQIDALPTMGADARDQEAMDIIHRAAAAFREH